MSIFLIRLKEHFGTKFIVCFLEFFRFCTSSSAGYSVGRQKRYATSSHVYMTSSVNVCDVKGAENCYVC